MDTHHPLQSDYVRYPRYTRGGTALAALHVEGAARGMYNLSPREQFWREVQPFLLSKGYSLRPRYAPDWSAPWVGTDILDIYFETSHMSVLPNVMDARRDSDGVTVAIKWIEHEELTQHEIDVIRYLSSPERFADLQNHCNPLLDTFSYPDKSDGVFMVTPWLNDFYPMPIEYVNDLVDMMLQTFEGLVFMHRNGVAHRDCTDRNILQDLRSAFPGQCPHPQRPKRSRDWVSLLTPRPRCMSNIRYYFIDFGISVRLDGPGPHLVTGRFGRDPTAPELSNTTPYDPFKLDVYILGNYYLQEFVLTHTNLSFLRPLLIKMTRRNLNDRPSAEAALRMLKRAALRPPGIAFRWRLRPRSENAVEALFNDLHSLGREAYFQVRSLLQGRAMLSFGRP